jgi:hypothetical protein
MINEQQANKLLSQCEIWLEANLTKLRKSLRGDHENTRPMLWELIVLHATASCIALKHEKNFDLDKNISSQIQHEPVDGSPDILLQPSFCQPFNIEITYINAQVQQEKDLRDFYYRVRDELSKREVEIQSLKVILDPANHKKIIEAPSNNRWKHYFQSAQWNSFVTGILAGDLPLNWDIDEGNIIVKIAEQGQEFMPFSQYPQIPMTESPVYKAIAQKAIQARKWIKSGKEYQPLVLIIGASEILTQINNLNILSEEKIIEAINTALSETSGFGFGDRTNHLRVSNSKLISAVVFVAIRDELRVRVTF